MTAASVAFERRSPAVFILADDLSGAADCGIACVEMGLATTVALRPGPAIPSTDVVAIDADTRAMTAEAAAEITMQLALSRGHDRDCLIFKKLDSTLRGHVGPELAAVLRAVRVSQSDAVIVLAPAFPALGRTTVDGCQRLHGAPLEQSEIWQRERGGETASLPKMLRPHGLRVGLLPLDRIRGDVEDLKAAITNIADSADVIICDAETDADLLAIAAAGQKLRSKVVWAGAAGLARQVVKAAGLAKPKAAFTAPTFDGSAVFVVGSRSGVSTRQAVALAAFDDVVSLETDPTSTLQDLQISGIAARLGAALDAGQDAIIWQPEKPRQAEAAEARACVGLAELLAAAKTRIGALFATGGDTAHCLLRALDVDALELVREIEPGVPLSIAMGPHRFPVITKAGAFGTDATMTRCRSLLRHGTPTPAAPASGSER
jgi:4-hydroxythreonine-4-phosphate dehydrogenase